MQKCMDIEIATVTKPGQTFCHLISTARTVKKEKEPHHGTFTLESGVLTEPSCGPSESSIVLVGARPTIKCPADNASTKGSSMDGLTG